MTAVVEVAVGRISPPLHTPFVTSLRRTAVLESVLVRLTDDAGRTGLGEAPQVWRVTGESMAGTEGVRSAGGRADVLGLGASGSS